MYVQQEVANVRKMEVDINNVRCETCLRAERLTTYEGETGGNGYTRIKQHLDSLRLKDVKKLL